MVIEHISQLVVTFWLSVSAFSSFLLWFGRVGPSKCHWAQLRIGKEKENWEIQTKYWNEYYFYYLFSYRVACVCVCGPPLCTLAWNLITFVVSVGIQTREINKRSAEKKERCPMKSGPLHLKPIQRQALSLLWMQCLTEGLQLPLNPAFVARFGKLDIWPTAVATGIHLAPPLFLLLSLHFPSISLCYQWDHTK